MLNSRRPLNACIIGTPVLNRRNLLLDLLKYGIFLQETTYSDLPDTTHRDLVVINIDYLYSRPQYRRSLSFANFIAHVRNYCLNLGFTSLIFFSEYMNNSTVLTDEDGILMWVYKGQTDHSPLISAIRQQLPKSDRTENPSGFLVDIDSSDRIPVHIRSQDNLSLLGEYKIQSIGQSSLVLEEINTDKNRPISLKEFIRLRVFFHRSPIELNKALVSAVAENLKQITVHFKSDESVISTGDYREILLFLYRKLKGRVAETKFLSHQLS